MTTIIITNLLLLYLIWSHLNIYINKLFVNYIKVLKEFISKIFSIKIVKKCGLDDNKENTWLQMYLIEIIDVLTHNSLCDM